MRMFNRVAIVCDKNMSGAAIALRSVLECFALRVDFHNFVQKRQVVSFFAELHPEYSHTIIVCHGSGGDDEPYLMFDVVDQVDGHYDEAEGWEGVTVKLTPSGVLEHVRGTHGTVVSLACGSGCAALARAFLAAGCDAYIGPTSPYLDSDAAVLFALNYFYFLLAEDRDYAPERYTDREAVEKASMVDAGWKYGTESFVRWAPDEAVGDRRLGRTR